VLLKLSTIGVSGSKKELCCTLINPAGECHSASLELQAKLGMNFLLSTSPQQLQDIGSSHSTYLGMREIVTAAKLLDAAVQISFEETCVIASIQFEALPEAQSPQMSPVIRAFTSPAQIACLSSLPMQKQDAEVLLAPAIPVVNEVIIIALDDDKAPRALAKGLIRLVGASDQSVILGEFYNEAINVSQPVFEAASKVGEHNVVCVFDQNMIYSEGAVLGSDLTKQLRDQGFNGLIIVRSANDSEESQKIYLDAGASAALSKGTSAKVVAKEIKQLLIDLHTKAQEDAAHTPDA